jgi:hypothetical protein
MCLVNQTSPSHAQVRRFAQNTVAYTTNVSGREGPIWETRSRAQLYAMECQKCLKGLTANDGSFNKNAVTGGLCTL